MPSFKGTCFRSMKARAASPPTLADGMRVFRPSLMTLARKRRRSGTAENGWSG